jgi:hypothetical protein
VPPRALLYVYSNKNIAGCLLGLGALAAFFTGVIHDYWIEIVAGAYGIGALAVPGQPALDTDFETTMTSQQISDALGALVSRIAKLVPEDVLVLVQSIVTSINAILPMLDAKTHAVVDQDAYTIRQTALHYLPDTIAAYLKLPPAFRNLQPLDNGKTAKALLVEQLTVLDGKMKDIAKNLTANDAQALVANGEFLRERFTKQSFLTAV